MTPSHLTVKIVQNHQKPEQRSPDGDLNKGPPKYEMPTTRPDSWFHAFIIPALHGHDLQASRSNRTTPADGAPDAHWIDAGRVA